MFRQQTVNENLCPTCQSRQKKRGNMTLHINCRDLSFFLKSLQFFIGNITKSQY